MCLRPDNWESVLNSELTTAPYLEPFILIGGNEQDLAHKRVSQVPLSIYLF